MKIKKNIAKCLLCGDTLESVYDGQRETCECGNLTIDGGLEYLVRFPLNGDHTMKELAEMESELAGVMPFEVFFLVQWKIAVASSLSVSSTTS